MSWSREDDIAYYGYDHLQGGRLPGCITALGIWLGIGFTIALIAALILGHLDGRIVYWIIGYWILMPVGSWVLYQLDAARIRREIERIKQERLEYEQSLVERVGPEAAREIMESMDAWLASEARLKQSEKDPNGWWRKS